MATGMYGTLYGSMANAPYVTPVYNVGAQMTALQKSGVRLSALVLYMIAGYVAVIVFYLVLSQKYYYGFDVDINPIDTSFANHLKLLELHETHIQNNQSFVKDMSQMILLNLLLPILTAILGYVFGTRADNGDNAVS